MIQLKTPKFWTEKNSISYLLLPLSFLYLIGFILIRSFTKSHRVSKPVICVGNAIAGGSGKTPTAIAVGKILCEMGHDFAFLSRGYMGDDSQFLMLRKSDKNNAKQVGDEPLLLIDVATTFVAKDRLFGARQIERMNQFEAIIIDDGMQNGSLYKDFTIMAVDGKIGFGNDFLIPAGPMRERLSSALRKADLVVVIGEAEEKLLKKLSGKTIVNADIIPINIKDFCVERLIAFCGLAYPNKFFSFLENQGLNLVEKIGFADHYQYSNQDLEKLCKLAEEKNSKLVTTKKDWIKFSEFYQEKISYLDISLEIKDRNLVKNMLKKII